MKIKAKNQIFLIICILWAGLIKVHGQPDQFATGNGEFQSFIMKYPERIKCSLIKMHPHYIVCKPSVIEVNTKLPLIIYLHGAGKRNATAVKLKGGVSPAKYWQEQEGEYPFIIVGPHSKGMWDLNDLELFFEHIKATLPVDLSRVYLTGYSMGGAGTWNWAQSKPEYFAAIAPLAGGIAAGGPKEISEDIVSWQENLKEMPTWIIHGADDKTVPAERSELMYQGLKEYKNKHVKLTILEGKGHAISGQYKAMPEIFDWFLSFKKENKFTK
jgi:predicted peptidase